MGDACLTNVDNSDQIRLIQKKFELNCVHDHDSESNQNSMWMRSGKNNSAYRCRRPSLLSRLQDGKNLQLCFLNQQSSEVEDNQFEDEAFSLPICQSNCVLNNAVVSSLHGVTHDRPLLITTPVSTGLNATCMSKQCDTNNNTNKNMDLNIIDKKVNKNEINRSSINWLTSQSQNEVYAALRRIYADTSRKAESGRRQRSDSPITCTIRTSLKKVGVDDKNGSDGRRRMSRQMLTKMNSYQLQTIIDDLHIHVEYLNEQLMNMLMERDELHMSRDSLLVDIEDITAYLDAKQMYMKSNCVSNTNYPKNTSMNDNMITSSCPKNIMSTLRFSRLTSYVRN